jgi:DNA-binding NarL/FixJ family response regulator
MSKRIRVLVVDDHPILRQGLAAIFANESDLELVAEATNGLEALAHFRALRPDITLLDIQMPEMNGVDCIKSLRAEFPDARVIVLTTYEGDVLAQRALKAGAQGYVLKGMLRKELLDTIRAVHAGQRRISPEVATQIAQHTVDDALSDRELEVLRLIATGNSNKRIARRLFIAEETVKGHVHHLLQKSINSRNNHLNDVIAHGKTEQDSDD